MLIEVTDELDPILHGNFSQSRDQKGKGKPKLMRNNALRDTINSGAKVVQGIAASKDAVSDVFEEGKDTVTKFLKETRHAAEERFLQGRVRRSISERASAPGSKILRGSHSFPRSHLSSSVLILRGCSLTFL